MLTRRPHPKDIDEFVSRNLATNIAPAKALRLAPFAYDAPLSAEDLDPEAFYCDSSLFQSTGLCPLYPVSVYFNGELLLFTAGI